MFEPGKVPIYGVELGSTTVITKSYAGFGVKKLKSHDVDPNYPIST